MIIINKIYIIYIVIYNTKTIYKCDIIIYK